VLVSGEAVTSVVSQLLAERTEKVCEMAGVMKEAVRVDDEDCSRQQELLSRLATENKGLRELLDIAQRSSSGPRLKKLDCASLHKEVQTERAESPGTVEQEVSVTLPMPPPPRRQQPAAPAPSPPAQLADNSGGDSDEASSEDETKYDTIKLARRDKTLPSVDLDTKVEPTRKEVEEFDTVTPIPVSESVNPEEKRKEEELPVPRVPTCLPVSAAQQQEGEAGEVSPEEVVDSLLSDVVNESVAHSQAAAPRQEPEPKQASPNKSSKGKNKKSPKKGKK